jgi:hypothetical protein
LTLVSGLNCGTVGFAVLAALFWWRASAAAAIPARTVPGFGNNGGAVQQAVETVRRQSRWSSAAAGMAGCAAMLQAFVVIFGELS